MKSSFIGLATALTHLVTAEQTVCLYRGEQVFRIAGDDECLTIQPGSRAPQPQVGSQSARVAICLSGTPRTFTRPHVFHSFTEKFLGGLGDAMVDVFAVMQLEDAPSKEQRQYVSSTQVNVIADDISRAISPLSPSAIVLESQEDSNALVNKRCNVTKGFMSMSDSNLVRSIAQPANWESCWREITRAEANSIAQYDWVIRSRFDVWWFAAHPPLAIFDRDRVTIHKFKEDWHTVMPRAHAEAVMRGMIASYRSCDGAWGRPGYMEGWLLWQVKRYTGHRPVEVDFPNVVVRQTAAEPTARKFCRGRTAIDEEACIRGAYPEASPLELGGGPQRSVAYKAPKK